MISRKDKEPTSPLLQGIDQLCALTHVQLDYSRHVRQAFLLGLWHTSFPEYMLGNVEYAYLWQYEELQDKDASIYDEPYANLQKFQFVSDTGDSWHQCYRDLRQLGWKRLKVHRNGGRLQYLLHNHRLSMPEGYQDLHLILDISISTCKQVQIGTETKEVPIMKTVCEDLVELDDDKEDADRARAIYPADDEPARSAEVVPLVVIDDIDELQRRRDGSTEEESRCEHGNLSGCCGQSDCQFFMGHDDPDPTLDPFKDGIPF